MSVYDAARGLTAGGRLTQGQVEGLDAILAETRRLRWTDPRWTAYAIATAWHETGARLQPVEESLSYSASRIGQVWPRLATRAVALARNPEALAEAAYGGRLGNGPEGSGDGWRYRGRGLVQITGRENYRRRGAEIGLPLEDQPDLALQMDVSVALLCGPMAAGSYTGKALRDYFAPGVDDPVNARRIINADVAREGENVARLHRALLAGLLASPLPPPTPEPAKEPASEPATAALLARIVALEAWRDRVTEALR